MGFENSAQRIRMFNSLNWPSFNTETLRFLNNNDNAQIIVATDTLSVGINSPVQNVVIFGLPSSIEEAAQKLGRIWFSLGNARGIIYLPRRSRANAQKVVDTSEKENALTASPMVGKSGDGEGNGKDGDADDKEPDVTQGATKKKPMDLGVARLVLTTCIPGRFNIEFDNTPDTDIICGCRTCREKAALPLKSECDCSGCQPEEKIKKMRGAATKKIPEPKGTMALTPAM